MNIQYKQRGWIWIGQFIQDIRFAIRMLRKNLGFTALAVLTLGLGIGAASTMFGVVDALVLNPFPYPDSGRIVYVWSNYRMNAHQPLSVPDFKDVRDQNKTLAEFGVYSPDRVNLGLDNPMPVYGLRCTAGVLRSFGMKPLLGRLLDDTDGNQGADPVAVISYSLWSRVFSSDPKIIGQTVRLDGRETTIVGIMPQDFEFQSPSYEGHDYELWSPLVLASADPNRGDHWLLGIGRLKDGVTIEAADAEIKAIGARLAKEYPDSNKFTEFKVNSLRRQTTEGKASGAAFLLGAVALLLLVACANVASLLLARGSRRQGEFGVRLALGGSRRDVIRLLLLENLVLALLGGIAGVMISDWGLGIMKHMMPSMLAIAARREAIQLNGTVMAFSIGLAMISVIFFGLLPAFMASRTQMVETLKSDSRSQTGTRLRHRFLRSLVAVQIAMAVVLGNGAVLLSTSYLKVLNDNRKLDTDQVVTAELAMRGDRYKEEETLRGFWQDLFERVKGIPGVESVALTTKLPLEGGNNSSILIDDEVYDPSVPRPFAEVSQVSPEYFSAMGISLLRGRFLKSEDADTNILGVVVNQALVKKCWPGQDPVGRRIRSDHAKPYFQTVVVGVVSDVRQWGAEMEAIPEIYFPYSVHNASNPNSVILTVRTKGDAHGLISSLTAAVAALDRDLPLANVRTMKEVVGKSVSSRRFFTQLVGLFMAVTLVLSMVGIYGTLSYTVTQQRREIGIRMAMGAMRRQILRFIFRQAIAWVIAGLAGGLALTITLSMFMRSAVYGVSPLNPLLLFTGIAVVSISAGAACFLPARRASRMDPMEALRCE